MSSQISILASAILSIQAGNELGADVLAKLNEFAAATSDLSSEDMMMPVDAKPAKTPKAPKVAPAPIAVASSVPGEFGPRNDLLRAHPSRLQTESVNFSLCMARKIDEDRVLAGTNKGEAGANGKVFYEKQCSKAPLPGEKLCKICAKKESEAVGGQRIKGWYGRLDESDFYELAYVVGCPWYFKNYPKGSSGDASAPSDSAPSDASATAAAAPAPASVPAATEASDKKKPGRKAKSADPAKIVTETAAPESAAPESVAVNAAPKALEWITCKWTNKAGETMYFVRNTKNGNVYARNPDAVLPTEAAVRDEFKGRWVNGTLDEFADEAQDE